jgi:hypothetical protein
MEASPNELFYDVNEMLAMTYDDAEEKNEKNITECVYFSAIL